MSKRQRGSLVRVAVMLLWAFSCVTDGRVRASLNAAQDELPQATPSKYGLIASSSRRPDAITYTTDLGAAWVRLNTNLNDPDPDFKGFLDAGVNVIITVNNQDPANIDTTYGTPSQWVHAGFPYRSKDVYQQRIRDLLTPLVSSLEAGREIWLQCENEIGDASVNPNAAYWRGTTDQYLTLLASCYEAVKSVNVNIPVVLTSFASQNLDAVIDLSNPTHNYQTQRMTQLLSEGRYDAADLHFYGCVDGIAERAQWVKNHLPPGRRWISTENSGPVASQCPQLPVSWQQDIERFEQVEAQQVPLRLKACSDAGASVCLWFSLFDLRGEVDDFNHLGVLDSREVPPRKKPGYDAFKSFVASQASAPVLTSVQILRKGKPVDYLAAGAKTKLYQINLNGSGFASGSVAVLGGMDAETTAVNSAALTAKLPGKRVGSPGSMTVQVRNSDGQISNTMMIEIRSQ